MGRESKPIRKKPVTTLNRTPPVGMDVLEDIPFLTIASHPDPRRIGERAPLVALKKGERCAINRVEPDFGPLGAPRLEALDDPYVSGRKSLTL